MKFKQWMETSNTPAAVAARKLGLSRAMIYNYMAGKCVPTIGVGLRIEELTGGSVTLYDWEQKTLDNTLANLL